MRSVAIYSDASRRDDARYVAAALRAAAQATGAPAVIARRDAASSGAADSADWIVWLAARPLPAALIERAREGATILSDSQDAKPQLAGTAPIWTDDTGRPLLSLRREGQGRVFQLHGRFHPSSGDLVLHPRFPEAMAVLWIHERGEADPPAGRVATSQLLPARDTTGPGQLPAPPRDLYHTFWLAAVVLFIVERVVASRPRATTGIA